MTVRVEDDLLLAVKRRALETHVSLQEVVVRLLRSYVGGEVEALASRGAEIQGDPASAVVPPSQGVPVPRVASAEAVPLATMVAALESGEASPPAVRIPAAKGCPMVVPRGVKCKACGKTH